MIMIPSMTSPKSMGIKHIAASSHNSHRQRQETRNCTRTALGLSLKDDKIKVRMLSTNAKMV